MSQLPIVHMTLYKHGVGFFTRRGKISGEAASLTFRREEMDDLLKSLTVIDRSGGQVRGIDYDTPQSRSEKLAGCSILLDDKRSLRDLLAALRGRAVRLQVAGGSQAAGVLVGLDETPEKPLKYSTVTVLETDSENVTVLPLNRLEGVELRDETAAGDLRFFLKTALGQESHRSITIRLSSGEHELEVSYIAPAPTWRVSYRLVLEETETGDMEALLQGWGIFDNRLEEDLSEISLSLTAGMPISFMYDLYTPHTPKRPVVKDEDRVASGPVLFEPRSPLAEATGQVPAPAATMSRSMLAASSRTVEAVKKSASAVAQGAELGELFQYNISVPVTVGRGQSAMAPIVSNTLKLKKELIYNGRKLAKHPVATLRFDNSSGLTLERGPVTVLDNGEYVGEAVLPFTADQAEAVVSYAVELGVHVREDTRHRRQFHSLEIKNAYLVQNAYDIETTRYEAENHTAQAKTIHIEHPRRKHFSLFDMPEPTEETAETYRFQVQVPANQKTEFKVRERQLLAHREELRQLRYQKLRAYFEQKLLSRDTYNDLKGLLDLLDEVSALQKNIGEAEQRRTHIFEVQEQIRQNLGALQQSGEEGKLRGQYVQRLANTETELADIAQKVEQLKAQVKQKEAEVEQTIAALG